MHKQINTCSLVDGKKGVNFGVKNRLHDAKSYSRVNKNYITREFYLHHEENSATSRCILRPYIRLRLMVYRHTHNTLP